MSFDAELFRAGLTSSAQLYWRAAGDSDLMAALEDAANTTIQSLKNGGTLFTCGNGGSAAQATHFSAELVGPFYDRQRPAYSSMPLGFDPAALTAVSNDFDYESVYARQLSGLGRDGDVLWGLSTSGNSPNVVKAMETAQAMGLTTVLFTNHEGGRAKAFADYVLYTPPCPTPRVQELHLIYGHCLCEAIEAAMVAAGSETFQRRHAA